MVAVEPVGDDDADHIADQRVSQEPYEEALSPASMRHVGVILREGFDLLVGDVASHRAMACKVARRRRMTVERENGIVGLASAPRRDGSTICP